MDRGVRVHLHRAELQHPERLSHAADAVLPEKYRAIRGQLDQRRDDDIHGQQHQHQGGAADDVQHTLQRLANRRFSRLRAQLCRQLLAGGRLGCTRTGMDVQPD